MNARYAHIHHIVSSNQQNKFKCAFLIIMWGDLLIPGHLQDVIRICSCNPKAENNYSLLFNGGKIQE